jgi:hypothetical protein
MKDKTQNMRSTLLPVILAVAIILGVSLPGCFPLNRVISEEDVAYSTKRVSLRYILRDYNRRSPLISVEQSVVKESGQGNGVTYKAYDVLTLSGSSFEVSDDLFWIIDGQAYPMKIDRRESDFSRSISEETKDIAISDSTSVNVVTGYSYENRKIVRFSYTVPREVVDKTRVSKSLMLRYYSGPDMMTVKLGSHNLNKLKRVIAQ